MIIIAFRSQNPPPQIRVSSPMIEFSLLVFDPPLK